jgi:hypothetical protein
MQHLSKVFPRIVLVARDQADNRMARHSTQRAQSTFGKSVDVRSWPESEVSWPLQRRTLAVWF